MFCRAGKGTLLVGALLGGAGAAFGQPCDPVAPMEAPYLSNRLVNCAAALEWVARSGVDGYEVARSTGSTAGPFTILGAVTTNRLLDSSVQPNTTYYYKVRGFNACGPTVRVRSTAPTVVPDVRSFAASVDVRCSPVRITFLPPVNRPDSWNIDVLRSTTQNIADATLLGAAAYGEYFDYAAVEAQTYWYWGRAKIGTCIGNTLGPVMGRQFYNVPAAPGPLLVGPHYLECASTEIRLTPFPACARRMQVLRGLSPDESSAEVVADLQSSV